MIRLEPWSYLKPINPFRTNGFHTINSGRFIVYTEETQVMIKKKCISFLKGRFCLSI